MSLSQYSKTPVLNADIATGIRVFDTPPTPIAEPMAIRQIMADLASTATDTAYTPTVTAVVGAFTTLGTVTGVYRELAGGLCWYYITIPITTNGTAAIAIYATLPFTPINNSVACGVETQVVGFSLGTRAFSGDNKLLITKYDGTYPGANGYTIAVQGAFCYL
jgi:hypothetical protein